MVTSSVGSLSKVTVKVVQLPDSSVVSWVVGSTWIPAVSSSAFVTVTSSGSITEYFVSELVTGPRTIVYGMSPSST